MRGILAEWIGRPWRLAAPRRSRLCAAATIAALTAGCMVGPNFVQPPGPEVDDYLPKGEAGRAGPQLARGDQILAVPTLVRKLPVPVRRIIGDLSNTERVLIGLDLVPRK